MLIKNILNKLAINSNKNLNLNGLLANFDKLSICSPNKYSTLLKPKPNNSNFININNQISCFSTTACRNDLMEFFDVKDNWEKETIRHGRPWKIEELRIKSNTDLHKLWYILHKERNMLLTMQQYYKDKLVAFPSPERIAKVDESMENIMEVVKERNVAYNLLEHGETKEYQAYRRYNSFGFIQKYRPREYLVPWWLNKVWKLKFHYKRLPFWSKYYRSLYRVKLRSERRRIIKKIKSVKHELLSKSPDLAKDERFQKYLEKKYKYSPPMPYDELMRRPLPTDLPRSMRERLERKNNIPVYDEEF